MAITRVQQSQISGSLSYSDNMVTGSAMAGKSTLAEDLNALRTLIKDIKGEGSWFDGAAQDLAQIHGAMRANGADAAFAGAISSVGNASIRGTLSVAEAASLSSKLTVTGDITGSAGLQLAGAADLNGALDVAGQVDLGGMMAATSVRGAFSVAGPSTLHAAVVSGSLKIQGDVQGRVYVVGDDGEITDSMGLTYTSIGGLSVSGKATASNGLEINGAVADFNAGVTANDIKIDGDTAGRLYMVGSSGEILDQAQLTFALGSLAVKSSMGNAVKFSVDSSTGNVVAEGTLGVTGAATLSSTLSVSGAATLGAGLTVNAAVADFNAGITSNEIKIDSDVAERLYIVGASGEIKDESKLTFNGSKLAVDGALDIGGGDFTVSAAGAVYAASTLEVGGASVLSGTVDAKAAVTMRSTLSVEGKATVASFESLGAATLDSTLDVSGNAHFASNVTVDGDLRVKGSMTYIDTQNMRVQDAFIYLATGSAGTSDSGIVLHGGAGAGMDLVIGQDGGAGEVIFGKGNRAPDGDGAMDGIALVASWMSGVKLGSAEGSLSGSLAASAGGIELKAAAGKSLVVEAGADLALKANGFELGLGSSAQYATFDGHFAATTIVGALNELYAAGAGGAKKGTFAGSDIVARELDFSSLGTLNVADQKFVDVYLNGVLLSYGYDISAVAAGKITFAGALSFTAEDVLTIVLRGAA